MISLVRIIESEQGKIFISILLGLGLATLFRRVCNERNCLLFRHPDIDDIHKNTYQHGEKCYNFREKLVKCNPNKKIVD
jgi:hypothetical protein